MHWKVRPSRTLSACLAAIAFLIVGCKPDNVRDMLAFNGQIISAADVVTYASRGDFAATAVLESASVESKSDNMDGSLFWRVTHCHMGDCAVGVVIETRYKAPFSVSGEFCRVPSLCMRRNALSDYEGESFFVGIYREAYVQQVDGVGGAPLPMASSLNGGYYLISGGRLYNNDPHWQVDAGYQQVLQLISEATGMSHAR